MKDKQELIQHIAERLQSHEEQYDKGAWEKFVDQENKRKKVFPLLYWAAAACALILLGVGAFYFLQKKPFVNQPAIANNNQHIIPSNKNSLPTNTITPQNILDQNNVVTHQLNNDNVSSSQPPNNIAVNNSSLIYFAPHRVDNNIHQKTITANANNFYTNILQQQFYYTDTSKQANNNFAKNNMLQNQSADQQSQTIVHQTNADSGKLNYFPSGTLDIDNQNVVHANFKRWSVDAVLTPSVSNNSNKINMGYGVAFGYNISKKFSVNSGASYTQLTAYGDNATVTNSNVQANVTGINVPIEMRYKISNKVYVNAGASALAVLSNKQQRNYIVANIASADFVQQNGVHLSNATTLGAPVQKMDNTLSQSQIGNQNVAGFFNFSIGLKQKLGTNTHLSIEPFVSIPMNGDFGKQNIHLTNAGVRIKFGL